MQEGRGTDRLHLGSNVLEVRDDCPSGVIYRPETERWSHYFEAHLPAPFDLLIRLDRTDALRPLDLWAGWDEGEPPETWPSTL